MELLRFIKPYLFKWKGKLILFTFLSIILWLSSIAVPYVTARYIDYIEGVYRGSLSNSIRVIYYFTAVLVIMWAAEIFGTFFSNMTNAKLQCNMVYDLNYSILEHIKRLPILFFNNVEGAYLNQRINSDSNTLISFVLNNIIQLFMKIVTFIVCLAILVFINYKIAAMLLILLPVYAFIYKKFKKPLYQSSYQCKEHQNKLFSKMNEQINNIKYIKLNSFYRPLGEQLNESFSGLYKATIDYGRLSYRFSGIDTFINRVCSFVIFFYGGIEIVRGNLTIGNFININSYFVLLMGCTSFFLNIGKSYQDAKVSYARIAEILKLEEEVTGEAKIDNVDNIEFKDVSFSYDGSKEIIKNFDFTFKKGRIYCIIGKNGIGKSTFLGLLSGLYNREYKGRIYFDSTELKTLDLHCLRTKILGVTEQEPILLGRTIRNNITLGFEEAAATEIEHWCGELGILDFIKALPEGFNYNISEKASNVSGGQKQKISQTRVFLKNPEVLILDEPTSALDVTSIEKLKEVLQKIKKDKIIIAVTHNSELLTIADEVINFEELSEKKIAVSS